MGLLGAPGRGRAAHGARSAGAGLRGAGLSSRILTQLRRMVGVTRWQPPPPHGTARLTLARCRVPTVLSHKPLQSKEVFILNIPHLLQNLPRLAESRRSPGGNSLDSPSTTLRRTWLLFILTLCLDLLRSKYNFSPSCA